MTLFQHYFFKYLILFTLFFSSEVSPWAEVEIILGTLFFRKKKRAKQTSLQIQHDESLKPLLEAWKREQQCQYILSYFDAYSKSGKLKEALETLFLFRERGYFYMKAVLRNVLLYNFFLKECAARADLKNVKTLTKFIIKDSVKMGPETFAYIFECVARTEDPSKEIGTFSMILRRIQFT